MSPMVRAASDPQQIIDNSGLLKTKTMADFMTASEPLPSNREEQPLAKEVPIVDMTQTDDVVAKAVANACGEWGFFQVRNHGIPVELLNSIRLHAHALFALPHAQKERATCCEATNFFGYGMVKGRTYFPNAWMEAFNTECTPVDKVREHVGRLGIEGVEFENLCGVIEEFIRNTNRLGIRLTEFLAQGLGLSATTFSQHFAKNPVDTSFMRMNYYPPCPTPTKTQGIGPHADFNIFTLLLQDTVPGLQILKGNNWITIPPHPDAFVVNVGDGLQAWCNNRVRSILHRSLVNTTEPRLSVGYFMSAPPDTVISAPADLVNGEEHPRHYRDFVYKDMVKQYFNNRGKEKFITPLKPYTILELMDT